MPNRTTLSLLVLVVSAGLVGCTDVVAPDNDSDDPFEWPSWQLPTRPTLEVVLLPEGLPADPDGYTIRLDDGPFEDWASRRGFDVSEAGTYRIELGDVAENCRVEGPNPRLVSYPEESRVVFHVICRGLERLEGSIVYGAYGMIAAMSMDGSPGGLIGYSTWNGGDVSSDGRRIAVAGEGLHVLRADGAYELQIAADSTARPAWSPDGLWIVYARGPDSSSDLHLARSDGREARSLTRGSYADGAPSWSPDGAWILFTRVDEDGPRLYVIRPDGSGLRAFTRRGLMASDGVWSPDGGRIAFVEAESFEGRDSDALVVRDLETRTSTYVLRGWTHIGSPSWAPGGGRLVFEGVSVREPGEPECCPVLWTSPEADARVWNPGRHGRFPTWSP